MSKVDVTVVIPVYNEGKRVALGLKKVLEYLGKQEFSWELIVVDDGSRDDTLSKIKARSEKLRVESLGSRGVLASWGGLDKRGGFRVVHLPENQGKGGALAEGFKRAGGERIVFSDVDLSVRISELPRLLRVLKDFDVVIGSRRVEGSRIVVHQSWLREQLGQIFTWLVSKGLGLGVSDATCGFKGFRAEVGKRLFGAARISRWAFDAEILYLARKWGYLIEEVPVEWRNDEQTRVRLGRDVLGSFGGLVKILVNDALGKY